MMSSAEMVNIINTLIEKNLAKDIFRLAEITAINAIGVCVKFDGETTASTKYYPVIGVGQQIGIGDRVLMARTKGSYVVFGKVQSGGASAYTGFAKIYPYNINGDGLAIGMGGRAIIGGGESARNLMDYLGTNYGDEQLHLAADSNVYIETNMQSGGAGRYTFAFGNDGFATMSRNKFRSSDNAYNISTVYASPNHYDLMLTQGITGYITIPANANTAFADFTWPVAFTEPPQYAIIGGRDGNSVNASFGVYNITATGCRVYAGRMPFIAASTVYSPSFQVITIGRKV